MERIPPNSVERVTRAIRWMVLVPRMLAYPPTVRAIAPSTLAEVSNHDTVREFHIADRLRFPPRGTSWAIVRSIPDSSLRSLKQCVEKARTRREGLVRNREEFRGQPSKRSDRSALNREISTLDNPSSGTGSCCWAGRRAGSRPGAARFPATRCIGALRANAGHAALLAGHAGSLVTPKLSVTER